MSCRASACLIAGLSGLLAVALSPAQANNNARPEGWGTVKGQVVLAAGAAIPERTKVDVNKDQGHCLSKGPILSDKWMVNEKNRGVKYALVWLVPEPGGSPLAVHPTLKNPPTEPAVMDQPCCMFEPHVLAMRQGQKLIIKNSSPIAHNANIQGGEFSANPLIPAGGEQAYNEVPAYRLPYQVSCNIHPWMKAYIKVFDNPYFAVTDADGKFEIKNAPAGKCRIVIWQEEVGWVGAEGRKGDPIEVKAGGDTEVKFDVKPKPKPAGG